MLFEAEVKIIILDFDGVIVESNDIKDLVFQTIFKRFPKQYDDLLNYHRTNVSVSRYAKFDYLLEKIGRTGDIDFKNELLEEFSTITLQMMRSVPFVAGAKEFLKEIHTQFPTYLASVTPINDLEIILDILNIKSFFKGVYGCPPWTKPNAIRDILWRENCATENAVLIGDSNGDQKAAAETCITFVARNSGLIFDEPYPSRIVPNLINIAGYFKK